MLREVSYVQGSGKQVACNPVTTADSSPGFGRSKCEGTVQVSLHVLRDTLPQGEK